MGAEARAGSGCALCDLRLSNDTNCSSCMVADRPSHRKAAQVVPDARWRAIRTSLQSSDTGDLAEHDQR